MPAVILPKKLGGVRLA